MTWGRLAEGVIDNLVYTLLGAATVWFWAWLFKPDIDSGTVWVLGLIFGSLSGDVYRARRRA